MPVSSPESSPHSPRLLIVDDDAGQRSLLDSFLASQGFETVPVSTGQRALEVLREQKIDMMISDVRMPGLSGLDTLRLARKEHRSFPILLVTAYADVRDAVGAMRDGAVNYLSKPIDLDELLASVRQATGMSQHAPLKFDAGKQLPPKIVAASPLMQALFQDVSLVAASESRVLITGESGVGKEVVADVIHGWSRRAAGNFVKVNCAAIPETLLESELFGHEKGAFTGASSQRIGRFELADGGTIFLDEIADMAPQLQAKLLRVAQNGSFQRIGSNTEIHADARLSAAVSNCLEEYSWPGNVRELRNAMERAALLCRGDLIVPEHLPARIRPGAAPVVALASADAKKLDEVETQAVLLTLRKNDFNRTATAKALGISRRALIYKLQRLRELGHVVDGPSKAIDNS